MTGPLRRFAACLCLFLASGCDSDPPQQGGQGWQVSAAPRPRRGNRSRYVHQAPAGAPLKLAFVCNNASEFWNIAKKGIKKAEEELGIQVDVKQPNPATIKEQVRILEDLENQGYQGIAISALHPKDMNRMLNRLAEKMNVLTHDSDAPESRRLVYIGTNNYQAGEVLGQEVKQLFPKGAHMAVFVGTFSADNARQRFDGLKKALQPQGASFVVEAKKEDNEDHNLAKKNVEDVLNAYPEIELLVGLWAYNGPAIASALKASGKQGVKVVCFDEDEETLRAIKEGLITCTIVQKPFEFGYRSSVLMKRLATEGAGALPPDDVIDTGVTVIDSSNVDSFWASLRELKK